MLYSQWYKAIDAVRQYTETHSTRSLWECVSLKMAWTKTKNGAAQRHRAQVSPALLQESRFGPQGERTHLLLSLGKAGCQLVGFPLRWCATVYGEIEKKKTKTVETHTHTPTENILFKWLETEASHLPPSLASDSEAEKGRLLCVALDLELGKACCVAFNGLRNLPVNRVQLHGSHHPVLLKRESKYSIQ